LQRGEFPRVGYITPALINLILHCSSDEVYVEQTDGDGNKVRRYKLIEQINQWLNSQGRNHGDLVYMNPHAGGERLFEGAIFMGAFNYLDIDGLMRMLKSLEWEDVEQVQLFARTDEDQIFEEVD
jgi:hypothetical protein